MRKYWQRPHTSESPGTCFISCICSILEIDPKYAPDPKEHWNGDLDECWREHRQDVENWLSERGYHMLDVEYLKGVDVRNGYAISSGPSPRHEDVMHSVVTLNGEIVHDPHPDDNMVDECYHYTYLVPLDPVKTHEHGMDDGFRAALQLYAHWKDGTQYVGNCGMTLAQAMESRWTDIRNFMEVSRRMMEKLKP